MVAPSTAAPLPAPDPLPLFGCPASLPRAPQSEEFLLRAQAGIPPAEAIEQATANCARLFGMEVRGAGGGGGLGTSRLLAACQPTAPTHTPHARTLTQTHAHMLTYTHTNKHNQQDSMGTIAAGIRADLTLWSSDPSSDASVLASPSDALRLVVKEGLLAAAPGGAARGALAAVNARLAPA